MINGYSLCLNEWVLDKDIKNELGLLLIISSLSASEGYCFASNKYFSKLFNENEITICRKIKKLEKKNYITIEYEKRGCEIVSRKIRLTKLLIDDYQNSQSTINENVKENNISIMNNILLNTTNNTMDYKDSIEEKEIKNKEKESKRKEIVDYLNFKMRTHYRYNNKITIQKIDARLNEGYDVDDFKIVIDKKYLEWYGTDMQKHLTPETLFGNKFEKYLNQEEKVSVNKMVSIAEKDEEWGEIF